MGKSKDIRAGGAFYELWGKDGLSGVLDSVKKKAIAFNAFMSKLATRVGVAGAALTTPLTALFKGGLDRAADLARLSRQLGLPIQVLNKLQYAADAAGVSLDEVMNDWTGRYSDLVARAPGIDPKDAQEAAKVQLELADATRALQLALLPLVQIVSKYVSKLAEFVKNNASTAKTVLAVGASLVVLAAAIKLLTMGFAVLGPVATVAWAAVTGPVGFLAVAALTGAALGVAIAGWVDDFKTLGDAGRALGKTLGTAFGGIKDALEKADIGLAWKIIVAGLNVVWLEFVEALTTTWVGTKMIVLGTWEKIVAGLQMMWIDFTTWLQKQFNNIIDGFLAAASFLASHSLIPGGEGLAKSINEARERNAGANAALDNDAMARKKALVDEMNQKQLDRLDELRGPQEDLARAKNELLNLRLQAAEPAPPGENPFTESSPLKPGLLGAASVKGTFSGSALGQQIGASDQVVKQTELLKALKDGKGQLPAEIAGKLAPVVEGLFKIR